MKSIVKRLAVLLTACTMALPGFSQSREDNRPYNLQKAYEVLQNDHDEDQALKLLSDQIKSTPDNVECWLLMCRIYRNQKEYGRAMSSVNEAIRVNKPKKSGFVNSTLYWWKSSVYDDMGNNEQEIEWLKKALDAARKDNKENVQNISFDLGQAYYEAKKYDESDAVYRQMVKEDETDQAAMTGLARNMIQREDYPASYRTLLQVYDKKGETNNAIDAAIEYVDKDSDPSWRLLINAGKKNLNYAVANMRVKMKSSDKPIYW